MTFDIQYAAYKALDEAVYKASADLNSINGIVSGPCGLTPDSVKATKEYQDAKKAYDLAFVAARRFNGPFVKKYGKELREIRDQKRALK